MHPRQIFTDYSQCEHLGAGKDGNNAGCEGKARHFKLESENLAEDEIYQNQEAQGTHYQAQEAGKAQGQGAEPGDHIEGMSNQFSERIIGFANGTGRMGDWDDGKVCRSPGQKDIDIDQGAAEIGKRLTQAGAEGAKGAEAAGCFGPHGALQNHLGHQRGHIAQ